MKEIYHSLVVDDVQPLPLPDDLTVVVELPAAPNLNSDYDLDLPKSYSLNPREYGLKYNMLNVSLTSYKNKEGVLRSGFEGYTYTVPTIPQTNPVDVVYVAMKRDYDSDRLDSSTDWHTPAGQAEDRIALKDSIARGELPPLSNGFSFVIDRRPDEVLDDTFTLGNYGRRYEAQKIPSSVFTGYFSQRQVPIADKDHLTQSHDIGHIRQYQKMFENTAFADLVEGAAINSEPTPELCKIFTEAIDSFGDTYRALIHGNGRVSHVLSARAQISKLINLAFPNPTDDPQLLAQSQELFSKLWTEMGFADWEDQAKAVRKAKNQELEEITFLPAGEKPKELV